MKDSSVFAGVALFLRFFASPKSTSTAGRKDAAEENTTLRTSGFRYQEGRLGVAGGSGWPRRAVLNLAQRGQRSIVLSVGRLKKKKGGEPRQRGFCLEGREGPMKRNLREDPLVAAPRTCRTACEERNIRHGRRERTESRRSSWGRLYQRGCGRFFQRIDSDFTPRCESSRFPRAASPLGTCGKCK